MPSQSLIAVAILLGLVACVAVRPEPPVWPSSFEVSYTITLPYTGSVQPTPLKYPVHVWYDGKASLMRVSFYDGLDDMYVLPGAVYNLYPRISKKTCMFLNTTTGPTLGDGDAGGLLGSGDIPSPLPDVSDWQYAGTALLPGKAPTYIWQLTLRSFEKVATYTFHVGQRDNRPVHLDMLGVNLLTGSHFDHYVVDFGLYQPLMSSSVFRPPALCNNAKILLPSLSNSASAQAFSALPSFMAPSSSSSSPSVSSTAGLALTKWWQDLVQRVSGSEAKHAIAHDLHTRRAGRPSGAVDASPMMSEVLTDNLRFILEWNEKGRVVAAAKVQSKVGLGVGSVTPSPVVASEDLFTVSSNNFVMWSDKQWQETVFGHRPESSLTKKTRSSSVRSRSGRISAHLGMFDRQLSDQELPTSVDWRGTGADGPVKDQASCGSCWAFATTGAMTGAWYLATNTSISFSEQQIVDCSWDYSVNGCWGGNVEPALQYIHEHGGIASESSYPYKGQNSWCRENQTVKAGVFKGFKSIPEGDELALMEAVATHGPVAIAFDAVHPTFKYYSEGVYYREDCGQDLDHLNHAVTLVGYGTTPGGTDYWLLRNSWSQYWGDGGYFKMARKGNDCGVTLDAVVAVVDQSAVDRMMRLKENKQQAAAQ